MIRDQEEQKWQAEMDNSVSKRDQNHVSSSPMSLKF